MAARPPPVQQRPPMMAPPAQSGGGMMSGIGGMVVTGMALGAGSEIGHQAVRGLMGSGSGHSSGSEAPVQQAEAQPQYAQPQPVYAQPMEYAQQQQQVAPEQANPCMGYNMNFLQCLKQSSNEISLCQFQMDQLMSCQKENVRFYGV